MADKVVDIASRLPYAASEREIDQARASVQEALDQLTEISAECARNRRTRGEVQLARDKVNMRMDKLIRFHRIEVLSDALNAALRRAGRTR